METFVFIVMSISLCDTLATFQKFMNRMFETFIGKFMRDFIQVKIISFDQNNPMCGLN